MVGRQVASTLMRRKEKNIQAIFLKNKIARISSTINNYNK
jgi:hypothetical protein